jgi:hypothetical protein
MTTLKGILIFLLAAPLFVSGCGGGASTLVGDAAAETHTDPAADPVSDDPVAEDEYEDEVEPPPEPVWARAYHVGSEVWPNAAAPAADGGMVVAGEIQSPSTEGSDIVMLRLDPYGNVVARAAYAGGANEHVTDMKPTLDGNFIIAGAVIDSALGSMDMMALKIDPDGDIIWQFTYGSASYEWAHGLEVSSDGGYVLAGESSARDGSSIDMAVVRLDAGGNITWQKIVRTPEYGWAISVDETAGGHHMVLGETYRSDGDATALWVLKIDGSGSILLQKSYGGETWNDAGKIIATPDGGALVAGYTQEAGAGGYDFWLMKIDADGDAEWQKSLGGPGDEMAYGADLIDGGGCVAAGPTWSFGAGSLDMLAVELDGNGSVLWARTYGGPLDDYATSVVAAPGGGLAFVGSTSSFGAGMTDGWVLKTDASGRLPASCPGGLGEDAALDETPTHFVPLPTQSEPGPGTMALRVLSLVRQTPDVTVDTQCE